MKGLGNYVLGYARVQAKGKKYYHARLEVDGRVRWTLQTKETATAALDYGQRLIARYEVLKKVKA